MKIKITYEWTTILGLIIIGVIITVNTYNIKSIQTRINNNINYDLEEVRDIESIKDIIFNCANRTTLKENAYCWNEEIKKIFKYNKTDDKIELTLEEIKERGGDCLNWARLYNDLALIKGYYSEISIIEINETNNHAFARVSNQDGYCILDQRRIYCFEYS